MNGGRKWQRNEKKQERLLKTQTPNRLWKFDMSAPFLLTLWAEENKDEEEEGRKERGGEGDGLDRSPERV